MRAVLLVLAACLPASGCRIDLDSQDVDANTSGRRCKVGTSSGCKNADSHSDFAWIEANIFEANCFGSSCHTGPTASGKRDLDGGAAYATLMGPNGAGGVMSNVDPSRALVVPGSPKASYLFFLIRGVEPGDGEPTPFDPPPSNIGYMPMSNALVCCQKIDAIERWITAGAMNN